MDYRNDNQQHYIYHGNKTTMGTLLRLKVTWKLAGLFYVFKYKRHTCLHLHNTWPCVSAVLAWSTHVCWHPDSKALSSKYFFCILKRQ